MQNSAGQPAQTLFKEVGGSVWSYESATVSGGEVTGSKEVGNLVITFTGGSAGACSNQGEKKELVTNKLHGRLGYLNKAKTEVGLILEPTTQSVVACKNSKFGEERYEGSIIGRITPVNTLIGELTLEYHQNNGVQEWRTFEGEKTLHNLQFIPGKEQMGFEGQVRLSNFKVNETAVSMEVKG